MRRILGRKLLGLEAKGETEKLKRLTERRDRLAEKLAKSREQVTSLQMKLDIQSRNIAYTQVSSTPRDAISRPAPSPEEASLYLDLMQRTLTGWIYADGQTRTNQDKLQGRVGTFDAQVREEGRDWPQYAHTMIGLKRLDNLQTCIESALQEDVPGDLIETGVWRGGASIFMRAVLKAHGVKDRRVWVVDSFEGLPPPAPDKFPEDEGDKLHIYEELAVPLEEVKQNFSRYGLLDDQVEFLKGWFRDTLPEAPIQSLAVLRLDGDMYESTMDALVNLYPKLSPGGYCIVDDYGAVPACKQAVHDYRNEHGIDEEIVTIDWAGSFWRRDS